MGLLSWLNKFLNNSSETASSNNKKKDYANLSPHEIHEQNYKNFNPLVDIIETDNKPLTSLEITFLDYINGKGIDNVKLPILWTIEYQIDFKYLVSKLLNNGYLQISSFPNIDKLKVTELKEILKHFNLKVSGKKADLVNRIKNEVGSKELEQYLSNAPFNNSLKYYSVTEKGRALTKNHPYSVTKDIDFEDKCLELINQSKFNEAYRLVCKWEMKKLIPRGLGIDWKQEYSKGLSKERIDTYKRLMRFKSDEIPKEVIKTVITTFICCEILGKGPETVLFNRLTYNKYSDNADAYLDLIKYKRRKISAEYEIKEYKEAEIYYYEILAAKDEGVCDICSKINRKKLPVSKAKIGLNFPPLHKGCRCTTIASFDS